MLCGEQMSYGHQVSTQNSVVKTVGDEPWALARIPHYGSTVVVPSLLEWVV